MFKKLNTLLFRAAAHGRFGFGHTSVDPTGSSMQGDSRGFLNDAAITYRTACATGEESPSGQGTEVPRPGLQFSQYVAISLPKKPTCLQDQVQRLELQSAAFLQGYARDRIGHTLIRSSDRSCKRCMARRHLLRVRCVPYVSAAIMRTKADDKRCDKRPMPWTDPGEARRPHNSPGTG